MMIAAKAAAAQTPRARPSLAMFKLKLKYPACVQRLV
jgi:hypothetical protein